MFYDRNLVVRTYNKLPTLDEAEHALKGKESSINLMLQIIHDLGFSSKVGLRLLHRHNNIDHDELMIETSFRDHAGFGLSTKATKINDAPPTSIPNSWALVGEQYVPVEFSTSDLIADPNCDPRREPALFQAISERLKSFELQRYIGPSLMGSEYIEAQRPAGHSLLSEHTDQEDRANVLRFARPEVETVARSVQTYWCVDARAGTSVQGLVTMTCKRICPANSDNSAHNGTFIHQQN